ncbi:MAG: hypothetical protein KC589_03055 [Nanoarchaeota archaeon]|nr:hypothetical protein [Nanoarchaeota archaeon]
MVQTLANTILKEMELRGITKDFYQKNNPKENTITLAHHISEMNITKCSLAELDRNDPGVLKHLVYLLQSEYNIKFDICEYYKIWKNRDGWQYGCFFDKGKGKRIQVSCEGKEYKCVRPEELNKSRKEKE